MLSNEGRRLRRVVTCPPEKEYFQVDDLKAHNFTRPARREACRSQYRHLRDILVRAGSQVSTVTELEKHPNSVFTRDTALVTPEGFIQLRMGLESRRGEEEWMAGKLKALGEPFRGRIAAPGRVEGGDVILAGKVAFVGHSRRTNREGIKQLSTLLEAQGYQLRSATVPAPYLHLGGAMSMLGPERVLSCQGVFPEDFFQGYETIEVRGGSFENGNVICLGDQEVIAHRTNREAIDRMEGAGIIVHTLDLSEFLSGTGGPSCLILPLERA